MHGRGCFYRWADLTKAFGQKGVYQESLCESLFGLMPCPNRTYSHHQSYSHVFDHPLFQTLCMFIGEMICFLVLKVSVNSCGGNTNDETNVPERGEQKPFNPVIFLFPACCDMIGSSILMVSLTLTSAASFQMLRASVIVFTGFLSVTFLGRQLRLHHGLGMFLVVAGLVVVGLADYLHPKQDEKGHSSTSEVTGDLLIVIGTVITAVQVTYEEFVIRKYKIHPLQVVAWEGVWGVTVFGLLQFPFYFILVSFTELRPARLENSVDAVIQVTQSWTLGLALGGMIISVAVYNYSGVTVAKEMSATTRVVLDAVRTLFIWAVSLGVGWETFDYLQLIGFLVLVVGVVIYYNILLEIFPLWRNINKWKQSLGKQIQEQDPLLIGEDPQGMASCLK